MLNLYLASSVVSEKLLVGVPYYILSFGGTHVRFPIEIKTSTSWRTIQWSFT